LPPVHQGAAVAELLSLAGAAGRSWRALLWSGAAAPLLLSAGAERPALRDGGEPAHAVRLGAATALSPCRAGGQPRRLCPRPGAGMAGEGLPRRGRPPAACRRRWGLVAPPFLAEPGPARVAIGPGGCPRTHVAARVSGIPGRPGALAQG